MKKNSCPNCKQSFKKALFTRQARFCPHCKIRLFALTSRQANHINFKKGTIKNLAVSFMWAVLFALFMAILSYFGISELFKPYSNQVVLVAIIIMVVFIVRDSIKQSSKADYYTAGVDTLDDYIQDGDESRSGHYSLTTEPLTICQCPNCQSYRMTDLFWFKRRVTTDLSADLNAKNTDIDKFVGCLKCKSAFTVSTSNTPTTHTNLMSWLVVFVFVIGLITLYIVMTHSFAFFNERKALVGYFTFYWGYSFVTFQTKLHVKNPLSINYQPIVLGGGSLRQRG